MTPNPATFGARIRELREAAGLNAKELAWRAGTTPGTVYSWERGVRYPRVGMLPRLAEALQTTVEALAGERMGFDRTTVQRRSR